MCRKRPWRTLLVTARPLPFVIIAAAIVHGIPTVSGAHPPAANEALVDALSREGFEASPARVRWLTPLPDGMPALTSTAVALVAAARPGEPADILRLEVDFTPEGEFLALGDVHHWTRTRAANESALVIDGDRAAWMSRVEDQSPIVHGVDCRGERLPDDWTLLQRWQRRIENWQDLGTPAGFAHASRAISGEAPTSLTWTSSSLVVQGNDWREEIDWSREVEGGVSDIARPGSFVTWTAERLRVAIGERSVQLLKAVGFAGLDYARRMTLAVSPRDEHDEVAEVREELGHLGLLHEAHHPDPETGWPPRALTPPLRRPLEGEGKWVSLENDPFVGAGDRDVPFVSTFLRPDPKRPYARVHVVAWDPRRIELHAVSGTEEPRSATGRTGTGEIPRDPHTLRRVVAAFNGGFRARHGHFGMGADDIVYLPPKPYAATIATLRDGSTALGTWGPDATVPDDVVSFRQNLTPLVQSGAPNPYRRHYWGGVPDGWTHESFTVRTALCLTREKFLAYMYGTSLDPRSLINAALAVRCDYAIHLDMNAGHTGFEFYRVTDADERSPLGRQLDQEWEAEGRVPGAESLRFTSRLMVRGQALMNFPRYIHRESRDFFYLTRRFEVGWTPIPRAWRSGEADRDGWQIRGLPQGGFPPTMARAALAVDGRKVQVLQLDARRLAIGSSARAPGSSALRLDPSARPGATSSGTPLVTFAPSTCGGVSCPQLFLGAQRFSLRASSASGRALVVLNETKNPHTALAAVGVDRAGMLLYAESSAPHRELTGVLQALGASEIVLLSTPLSVRLGSTDHPGAHVSLVRTDGPGGRQLFPETEVVPPQVWAFAQLDTAHQVSD